MSKNAIAAVGCNRKTVKAAETFADCAAEEIAWAVAANHGRKLKRQTLKSLREHIKSILLQKVKSLAEAMVDDAERK